MSTATSDPAKYSVFPHRRPQTARAPAVVETAAPPKRPPLHLLKQWSQQMEAQMHARQKPNNKELQVVSAQTSEILALGETNEQQEAENKRTPSEGGVENRLSKTRRSFQAEIGSTRSFSTRKENLKTSLIDRAKETASDKVWGITPRATKTMRDPTAGRDAANSKMERSPRSKKGHSERSHLDSPRVRRRLMSSAGPTRSNSTSRPSAGDDTLNLHGTGGTGGKSSSIAQRKESPALGLVEGEAALQKLLKSLGGSSTKLLGGDELINVESAESFTQQLKESSEEKEITVVEEEEEEEKGGVSKRIPRSGTSLSNRCPSCGSVVRTRTTTDTGSTPTVKDDKETQTPTPADPSLRAESRSVPGPSSVLPHEAANSKNVKIQEPSGKEDDGDEEEQVPYAYDPNDSSSSDALRFDDVLDDSDAEKKQGDASASSPVPRQIRLQVLQLEAQAMGRIVKEAAILDHQDRLLQRRKDTQRTVRLIKDYSKIIEEETRAASRLQKFPMPVPPKRKALNPRAVGSKGAVSRALRSERAVKSSEYFSGGEKKTQLDHELANRQRTKDAMMTGQELGAAQRHMCYDSAALQNKNVLRSVTEVSATPEELMKRVEQRTRKNRLGEDTPGLEESGLMGNAANTTTSSSYNSLADDLAFHSSRILGISSPSTVFFKHNKGLTVPPPASIYDESSGRGGGRGGDASLGLNKNLSLVNTTVTMGDQHVLRLNLD